MLFITIVKKSDANQSSSNVLASGIALRQFLPDADDNIKKHTCILLRN